MRFLSLGRLSQRLVSAGWTLNVWGLYFDLTARGATRESNVGACGTNGPAGRILTSKMASRESRAVALQYKNLPRSCRVPFLEWAFVFFL